MIDCLVKILVTIQVSNDVKIELVKLAGELQQMLGKKVSIDDAIRYLLKNRRNKELFMKFYGCLRGKDIKKAYDELRRLRLEEERRLERLQKSASA